MGHEEEEEECDDEASLLLRLLLIVDDEEDRRAPKILQNFLIKSCFSIEMIDDEDATKLEDDDASEAFLGAKTILVKFLQIFIQNSEA